MIKYYSIFLALAMAGCSAGRQRVPAPSTVAVARSMAVAGESVLRAERSLSMGRAAAALLERTATPEQQPAVKEVQEALQGASQELEAIRVSLQKGSGEVAMLQARIDGMADDYGHALENERRARATTARWRAWALRLGLLSGLLGVWLLRKPLLRLFGVPVM